MTTKFLPPIRIDLFELGVSALIVMFFMYFSAPVINALGLDVSMMRGHADFVSQKAMLYALAGVVAFAIGYWLVRRRRPTTSALVQPRRDWIDGRVLPVFVVVFAAGFLIKLARVVSGSYLQHQYIGSGQLALLKFFISLNMFHFIALAIAFAYYYHLKKTGDPRARGWAIIAWSVFGFEILCTLLTPGSRIAATMPVLIHLITRHYLYRRQNLRVIIVGALVVLVLFPVKSFFRDPAAVINNYFAADRHAVPQQWMDVLDVAYEGWDVFLGKRPRHDETPSAGMAPSADEASFAGIFLSPPGIHPGLQNAYAFASDSTFGRLGQAHVFSLIVDKTNRYFYGRGLLEIAIFLGVPERYVRKATGLTAEMTEVGKRMGLMDGVYAGIAPTNMGDFYMNFGLGGIVGGMFLVGVLFRQLYSRLTGTESLSGVFVYAIMWILLMHGLEQSLSAAYGKVLQIAAVLFAIHVALSYRFRLQIPMSMNKRRTISR